MFGSGDMDFIDKSRPGHLKNTGKRKVLGIPFKNPTKAQYAVKSGKGRQLEGREGRRWEGREVGWEGGRMGGKMGGSILTY